MKLLNLEQLNTFLFLVGVSNDKQSSSSLSCRAASTDIPDPLSPPLPIVHRFW